MDGDFAPNFGGTENKFRGPNFRMTCNYRKQISILPPKNISDDLFSVIDSILSVFFLCLYYLKADIIL